jgi:bacteriocin biosynthesis cyclodehydratase domain-containing protein
MTPVPECPRLKPWYRVAPVEDGLAFEYGETVLRFGGRAATELLPLLLPLLDGTRSLRELTAALGESIAPAIEHALETLSEHGLLAEGVSETSPALRARTAASCAAACPGAVEEGHVAEALRVASVAIGGSGPLAAELLRLLRLCGIEDVRLFELTEATLDDAAIAIAAPEAQDVPRLTAWNVACLESSTPWFQLLPFNGRFALVGPFYVPGETACYECYRLRRAANVGYEDEFWALERTASRACSTPGLDALLAGAATSLILRWLVSPDAFLPGRFFTFRFDAGLCLEAHDVFRVPRCPACSGLANVASPLPWAEAA